MLTLDLACWKWKTLSSSYKSGTQLVKNHSGRLPKFFTGLLMQSYWDTQSLTGLPLTTWKPGCERSANSAPMTSCSFWSATSKTWKVIEKWPERWPSSLRRRMALSIPPKLQRNLALTSTNYFLTLLSFCTIRFVTKIWLQILNPVSVVVRVEAHMI